MHAYLAMMGKRTRSASSGAPPTRAAGSALSLGVAALIAGCGGELEGGVDSGGPDADAPGSADDPGGGEGGRDAGAAPRDCERDPAPAEGEEAAPWRHGGGIDYPDAVHPACADAEASTLAELEAALDSAAPGEIVYVEDAAELDLTGEDSICVPEGVTLASGRGRAGSAGALVFTEEMTTTPLLRACGDGARFTGIRVRGADPNQCPPEYPDACELEDGTGGQNCRDCMPRTVGVMIREADRVEIDNSEISGFSHAGVVVRASEDARVHHSYIHHTQREGLGYGVVLYGDADEPTSARVERNLFNYNRHAIAASGELVQDYEARDNLVLPRANGHIFDVHGQDENTDDGTPWAGGEILIHGNTVLPPDEYAVVVRGRPNEGAWIWDNCLARASPGEAFLQRFHTGNFYPDESPEGPAPNAYGQGPAQCASVGFCAEAGGAGPRRPLARSSAAVGALGFGDFTGDGVTDVFRADGERWWYSAAGEGEWEELSTSSLTTDSLEFGDFTGDGYTDVFRATGSEWRYSARGDEPWATLRDASPGADELVFGDFTGDGRTDALYADGGRWLLSAGAAEDWEEVNVSSATAGDLAAGDFTGDGRDDVFTAAGDEWRYSAGAEEPWETLNTSGVGLSDLALADLSGDGVTDVVRVHRDRRLVSWGGSTPWQTLAQRSEPLADLAFGDFSGDGRDDVFRAGCL